MHLMSNLEPFRYADFSFIWNSAKAIRDRLDGNGLHLYPMNYWDWPNTPDKAEITQIERDRLWFEIWARYCWKLDRDPAGERQYWIGRLAEIYGSCKAAEKIYLLTIAMVKQSQTEQSFSTVLDKEAQKRLDELHDKMPMDSGI